MKAEYAAGTRGDDSPVVPIWAPPTEQWERLVGTLRAFRAARGDGGSDEHAAGDSPAESPADIEHRQRTEADDVAGAMSGVDWSAVRAAVADRSGDVRRRVGALADQVDWSTIQPAAAHISSALIAAVAAGRIPVGGPIGATVARAIVDQGGLGARVANELRTTDPSMPPDFRDVIDTTGSEAPPESA